MSDTTFEQRGDKGAELPIGTPTIGVVVPSYNRAGFLSETLAAILGQTRPPDAIVVVDDGSTDDTQTVLAGYAPRVQALRIANSGELVARNTGVAALETDLVAFCDSDDLWRPGYLAAMASLWRAEPHTRAAYGDFAIVRDGTWESASKFAAAPPGFWDGARPLGPEIAVFDAPIVARLIAYQPFFPSAMVVARRFFRDIGGWDEAVSRTVGMDFATHLRLAEHAPLGVVRAPLVGIRKHGDNYSADVQKMNLGDATVLEHVLRTRPSLAPHEALIRASIARRRREALETAFTRGDFAAVRAIHALLPAAERGGKIAAKRAVAALPSPLAKPLAALLLAAGSARAR
jgi:hypothetical protein